MVLRVGKKRAAEPPALLYARGSVLISRASVYPAALAAPHVVAFEDLFRAGAGRAGPPDYAGVRAALFLTFCYDYEVLRPLLAHKVKLVIAANFKAPLGAAAPPSAKPLRVQVISRRDGKLQTTFHPKLFLIRFARFLRVVVGSGNLFSPDWTAFGNCFFVRDFALLPERLPAPRSQFHAYLGEYLGEVFGARRDKHLAALRIDLLRYDMDGDCPLLVGSVPGQFSLQPPHHGYPLLLAQLRAHPPACRLDPAHLRVVCLTSSLGTVNLFSLHTLAHCLVPDLPFAKQDLKELGAAERAAFLRIFHVVFPTEEHVERAQGSPDCLFFRRATYDGFSFEQSALSLYAGDGAVPGNDRVVPHYKAIVVTFARDFGITDDTVLYLGSHNLTKPAWGQSANFDQRFTVCNFELGVVFPARGGSAQFKREAVAALGFAFPPQRYSDFDTPFFNKL